MTYLLALPILLLCYIIFYNVRGARLARLIRWSLAITTMIIILIVVYIKIGENSNQEIKRENLLEMLGTYQLDLARTDLETYKEDKATYEDLMLTFKEDGTFSFNKEVPFICKTNGTWEGAEIGNPANGRWNKMHGCNDAQFSLLFSADSIFQMVAMSPQKGFRPLGSLFFKKIKSGAKK